MPPSERANPDLPAKNIFFLQVCCWSAPRAGTKLALLTGVSVELKAPNTINSRRVSEGIPGDKCNTGN